MCLFCLLARDHFPSPPSFLLSTSSTHPPTHLFLLLFSLLVCLSRLLLSSLYLPPTLLTA